MPVTPQQPHRLPRSLRPTRLVAAVVLGAITSLLHTPAASAHAAGNTPASNYVSRVLSVKPTDAPFRARVIEAGNRLEVQWLRGPELAIADYDGFPYLRVGPDGVFENQQSQAVYLNADRQGSANVPDVNPAGPPEWRRLSTSQTVRFHYHLIHWMGSVPPPQVARAKNRLHKIQDWTLDVRQGSKTFVVSGDLRWIPGPSSGPSLALGLGAGLGIAGLAVALGRRRGLPRALPVFMAGLAALVIVDAIHLSGIAFGVRGGSGFGRMLSIGWISIGAWLLAIGSIVALSRRRVDALYVGVFAAGIIALVGGLSDIAVLTASSVPFAYSNVVARLSIALTLGLGAGLVIAGVVLTGMVTKPARGTEAGQAHQPDQSDELT